jgi:hypothetical protein
MNSPRNVYAELAAALAHFLYLSRTRPGPFTRELREINLWRGQLLLVSPHPGMPDRSTGPRLGRGREARGSLAERHIQKLQVLASRAHGISQLSPNGGKP